VSKSLDELKGLGRAFAAGDAAFRFVQQAMAELDARGLEKPGAIVLASNELPSAGAAAKAVVERLLSALASVAETGIAQIGEARVSREDLVLAIEFASENRSGLDRLLRKHLRALKGRAGAAPVFDADAAALELVAHGATNK
jgi:hypothetical protein